MDRQSVYSSHVFPATFDQNDDSRVQTQTQLENFILHFRHDNDYIYRLDRLLQGYLSASVHYLHFV